MTISTRLAGALACGLALAAAPAAAQNREHQQQAAELRILQEQQQQLSLALAQIAEALKAINARLDEAAAATRKGFADQELSIRGLGGDLSAIRERTQETDTRIRTLRDEIDALRTTMNSLPSLLTQAAPAAGRSGRSERVRRRRRAGAASRRPPRRPRRSAAVARPASRRRGCSTRPSPTTSPVSGRWRSRASRRCCGRSRAPSRPPKRSSTSARPTTRRTSGARRSTPTGWCCRTTARSSTVPDAYFKRGRAYAQTGRPMRRARVVGSGHQGVSRQRRRAPGQAGPRTHQPHRRQPLPPPLTLTPAPGA